MTGILRYLSSLLQNVWNISLRVRAFLAQQSFKSWAHLVSVSGLLATVLSLFGSVFKSGIRATVNLARGVVDSTELYQSLSSNPFVKLASQTLEPFVSKLQDTFGDLGGWFCWFFGVDWFLWLAVMALSFWVMSLVLRLVLAVISAVLGLVSKVMS